ncbi:MAG TPA: fructose-6-phosphate aldolase [Dehalococcoidia bacterium]|jgi:transaldolase|nr:fructose-6-phosphate aldolase [Dehalococcoidia bacterium]MEE2927485.1 fructose-6-phosphate aldolase [Chloroflexota bacterium]HIB10333.1 fructose-6-phosphate aldolase [Dehalococcoidia bacterium]HIM47477.1 fructose-6-phosphate aldolase [Dehalococcoidia bacterium]|tara:strand:- start:1993 stop:2652 length:660 start_codon:yes stop_codon:yes gene_type:complete
MKLFLDTANIQEIRDGVRLGVISGVTTNPSLAASEGIGSRENYKAAVQEISDILDGPISVEVVSLDAEGMVAEGREIAEWIPNPWVKIPSTAAGFEAISTLSRDGIKINQTLCFSLNQALLGAQAGSTVVSPFVGRLDDIGQQGMDLVKDIVAVFKIQNIETEVLAASIRHTLHCTMAAQAGAHIATLPYRILLQMVQHPLTDSGVTRFLADWEKAGNS